MSPFWHKADIAAVPNEVCFWGVKRTVYQYPL